MILKLSQNSHNDEILNENKPANENWLGEMGKSSGTPTQTLYRWWDNFCKETVEEFNALLKNSTCTDLYNVIFWRANEYELESAPFTYAARSRRTASVNFSASVRASLQVLDT